MAVRRITLAAISSLQRRFARTRACELDSHRFFGSIGCIPKLENQSLSHVEDVESRWQLLPPIYERLTRSDRAGRLGAIVAAAGAYEADACSNQALSKEPTDLLTPAQKNRRIRPGIARAANLAAILGASTGA